ncbi:hypothetical protein DY000_02045521 [Brassica cretica]|uniref:Major facilitator superfamily (MFS) profile domain-containing protein n=1 Tax=Brassica cretica TaxID=69181 RepID=A0ABQ7EQ59_BRACR|nr:hypothetical protein DY000_02045521 [Brassica cretica]
MSGPSEPLLLSHIGADDSNVDHKTRPEALTFDSIVEHSLSDFGFWQLFQVILVGLTLLFDAQQIFITVYTDAYPTGMPTSAFYIGGIVGGFVLALIPDVTAVSVVFSTNVWIYTVLKSVNGFSKSQTWSYAMVLISERVSTKWRPRATMIPFTFFVLGFMSLSGVAYLAQHSSWRFPYLYTAVPALLYCIFLYLFALESPRWLHLQGNDEEAIKVLKSMSSKNKTYLESLVSQLPPEQETSEELLRDINVNIYLSETLNAVVELPSFVITPIILERVNRRSSVLVNTLLGGASGVLCFVLSVLGKTGIAFAFELATFFCARIGFNLMAVYMVEMFPTCVRSSATMMFRQALVVGGACCPLIASIGRDLPSVSFAIFGIAMSGLGLFVLILPETKGSSLCDTMEEQEKRDQAINSSCC